LRAKLAEASAVHPNDADFLADDAVIELFRNIFRRHNAGEQGNSKRFERFTLLNEQPTIDKNETTDKGYINQQAVLASHTELVEKLYLELAAEGVIVIGESKRWAMGTSLGERYGS
jgi:feruloyl-CoA synthase